MKTIIKVIKILGVIYFIITFSVLLYATFSTDPDVGFIVKMIAFGIGSLVCSIGLLPIFIPYFLKNRKDKNDVLVKENGRGAITDYEPNLGTKELNYTEQNLEEGKETPLAYVESGNVLVKTDGSKIQDSEIPYIIEFTREKSISESREKRERVFQEPINGKYDVDFATLKYAQDFEILEDTRQIVLTTTNIETFFGRADFGFDKALDLSIKISDIEIENLKKPEAYPILKERSDMYYEFFSSVYEDTLIDFIDRAYAKNLEDANQLKTEKGRQNRIRKFFIELHDHEDRIQDFSIRIKIAGLEKQNNINIPYNSSCAADEQESVFVYMFFSSLTEEQLADVCLLRNYNYCLQFVYKHVPIGVVRLQKRARWLCTSSEEIEKNKMDAIPDNYEAVINAWHGNMKLH